MTEHDGENLASLHQRIETLNMAFRAQGLLGEIAQSVVGNDYELTDTAEAADVLLPPQQPGEDYRPRWELVQDAPKVIERTVNDKAEAILGLAVQLGMRQAETIGEQNLRRINGQAAIWLVEGGANRTSVVRRSIAEAAMLAKYGENGIENRLIYQFGSQRLIPTDKKGQPNPEYGVARKIAGDYLPDTAELDEFSLNLASARQAGYQVVATETMPALDVLQTVTLRQPGQPTLKLVQPADSGGGLIDGLTAVSRIEGNVKNRQFVIATNGQYRPKDELQASQWSQQHDIEMHSAVALGDEPGYEAVHGGSLLTTAERRPLAYVNEMVILQRLARDGVK